MAGRIRTEKDGALGWIFFDHPERRNAISGDMWRQLPEAARRFDEDPDVRVVILRGAGDVAFAAGADISEFQKTRSGEGAQTYDRENGDAM
ncbi:MAG: enoyl-CoA hydratase/isomerase family protein, partial [Myxococcota bacterium]